MYFNWWDLTMCATGLLGIGWGARSIQCALTCDQDQDQAADDEYAETLASLPHVRPHEPGTGITIKTRAIPSASDPAWLQLESYAEADENRQDVLDAFDAGPRHLTGRAIVTETVCYECGRFHGQPHHEECPTINTVESTDTWRLDPMMEQHSGEFTAQPGGWQMLESGTWMPPAEVLHGRRKNDWLARLLWNAALRKGKGDNTSGETDTRRELPGRDGRLPRGTRHVEAGPRRSQRRPGRHEGSRQSAHDRAPPAAQERTVTLAQAAEQLRDYQAGRRTKPPAVTYQIRPCTPPLPGIITAVSERFVYVRYEGDKYSNATCAADLTLISLKGETNAQPNQSRALLPDIQRDNRLPIRIRIPAPAHNPAPAPALLPAPPDRIPQSSQLARTQPAKAE